MDNKNLEQGLQQSGRLLVQELIRRLQSKQDTGDLISSVSFDVIEKANEYSIQLTSNSYLQQIDKGRRAGTMPPVDVITKWAKRKGITFASEEQVGYVIARSISRKGTKGNGIIQKTVNSVMNNISTIIGSSYRDDIVKNINQEININKNI